MTKFLWLGIVTVALAGAPLIAVAQDQASQTSIPLPPFNSDRITLQINDKSDILNSYTTLDSIGRANPRFFNEISSDSEWGPAFMIREGAGKIPLNLAEKADLQNARTAARKDQIRIYRAALNSIVLYGSGSRAIDVILSGLASNISMSMSASPFVAPTFERKFDTLSRILDVGPAAGALVSAITVSEGNQKDAMFVLAGGFAVKFIGDLIRGSGDSKLSQNISSAAKALKDTQELLTYNRMVHSDLVKLQKHAESLLASDSTLASEFADLQNAIELSAGTDPDDVITDDYIVQSWSDTTYKERIEQVVALSVRFKERVQAVRYVLDQTQGMIEGFEEQLAAGPSNTSNVLEIEAKGAIEEARALFIQHHQQWESLSSRFYAVDPEIGQWSSRYQAGADAYRAADLALDESQ